MSDRFRRTPAAPIFLLIALDTASIVTGVLASYWIRFFSGKIPLLLAVPPLEWYTRALGIITGVFLLALHSEQLYNMDRPRSASEECGAVFWGVTKAVFALMALTFLAREFSYSRATLILAWGLITGFLIIERLLFGRFFSAWKNARGQVRRVLLVGQNPAAGRILQQLQNNPRWGYRLIGRVETESAKPASGTGLRSLGSLAHIPEILQQHQVTDLLLLDPLLPREQIGSIVLACEKEMVSFRMLPDIIGMMTIPLSVEQWTGLPLLGIKMPPLDDPWNRFQKRVMDITVSLIALVILLPLLILIALAVRFESNGPVFYRQERLGQDGKIFRILKFRTMRANAEAATGPVWAQQNDPRRTALGGFLRRTNLDELPQLWNVLSGEMSLVGPRPERPHFVNQFKEEIPRYMARHRIKSGITGWAQIHGLRGDTSIEERTRYDLYYAERWSLTLDLLIMARSLGAVKNAY